MPLLTSLPDATARTAPPNRLRTVIQTLRERAFVKALVLSALILAIYADILARMAKEWWDESAYSQGLLIVPLALYVAWLLRRKILAEPAVPTAKGHLLSLAACALLLFGRLTVGFYLQRISFVILLAGLTATFWGTRRLRRLGFPFLLLFTMAPPPVIISDTITFPLQLLSSRLGAEVARFAGTAVFQDGNVIRLAHTTLGVEEACSGMNSISALVVASLLIGFLLQRQVWIRVLLLLLAIPIAIGVNVMRVAGSAILADYNQVLAQGFYHSFSGWLVFLLGALALILAGCILNRVFPGRAQSC